MSLNLALLSEDRLSDNGRATQPDRFWIPSRRDAHHRWSLPEMQAGIKLPSRVQQGPWSLRAVTPSEQVHIIMHLTGACGLFFFEGSCGADDDESDPYPAIR